MKAPHAPLFRTRASFLASSLLVLSVACGGAEPLPLHPGAIEETPSMECLPTATGVDTFTHHMNFAWLLTEQSFEVRSPTPPSTLARARDIQAWTEAELQEWLAQKSRLVEAARDELNTAAEESHIQRTLAGALVALMYEDVARVLMRVPTPSDLRQEPEIADAFRDVIDAQARPYLEHARRAYRACALNSRGHQDLRMWGGFCEARREMLPLTRIEQLTEGTVVTVYTHAQ